MAEFVPVLKTGELQDGAMKLVKPGGKDILLTRVNGKCGAVDNRCPHAGEDLSSGTLEETVVTCPHHDS